MTTIDTSKYKSTKSADPDPIFVAACKAAVEYANSFIGDSLAVDQHGYIDVTRATNIESEITHLLRSKIESRSLRLPLFTGLHVCDLDDPPFDVPPAWEVWTHSIKCKVDRNTDIVRNQTLNIRLELVDYEFRAPQTERGR